MPYGTNDDKLARVHTFAGESMNEMYWQMIHTIQDDGLPSSPRTLPTQELLHTTTHIRNPRQRVLSIPGRDWNPFFSLAETVWILLGRSDAAWISQFNSALAKVADLDAPNAHHFHGAYGERLRRYGHLDQLANPNVRAGRQDQLLGVYRTLLNDPDSRRAVAMLWNPTFDLGVQSNDLPCNVLLSFKLRANKLHLSVFNRSNDFLLGLSSTNIVQFTTIQEVVATWLGADVGMYTHYSDSLHLYDEDPFRHTPLNLGSKAATPFNIYDHVDPTPMVPRGSVRSPSGEWGPTQDGRWGDGWPQRVLLPIWEFHETGKPPVDASLHPPFPLEEEPYWGSVWYALQAYHLYQALLSLRRKGRGLQISDPLGWSEAEFRVADQMLYCLSQMRTLDWYVECVRWLMHGARLGRSMPDWASTFSTLLNPFRGMGKATLYAVWDYWRTTPQLLPGVILESPQFPPCQLDLPFRPQPCHTVPAPEEA